MKYFAICAAFLALLLTAAPAESRLDPRLEWLTLESEHFSVHYHPEISEIAPLAARIAEEAHQKLAPAMRWSPPRKTHLVLADVTDASNGFSTPFPYNRIVIYLTPPLEQPFSLTDQEDWLRLVITHEYVHTLHLDTVHRLPAWLRRVFGRIYFPNFLQPAWAVEGAATYYETMATAGGRGRSTYTDMVLRMATLENRFPTLAQASVFQDSWPAGETPYLFGVSFYEYLTERHGADLPGRLSQNYGGRPLPFMVDSTARMTFGATFKEEWPRWQQQLQSHYQAEKLRIGPTWPPLNQLTREGYRNIYPTISPSGRLLAYSSQTADRTSSLMLMSTLDGKSRVLLRRFVQAGGAGIAWLPDESGLIYAKLERDEYDNIFYDLFRYDLAEDREFRLTRGLRAGSPDISPDGQRILSVLTAAGGNRLALLGSEGELQGYLSPADDDRQYFSPRWSPDGRSIVVGVRDAAGRYSLRILDAAGELQHEWSPGAGIVSSPVWSPDGSAIFFSTDVTGIYNLYAWRPADQTFYQVTHLLGGAFSPSVAATDATKIYLSAYSARGFDIATIPLQSGVWQPIALAAEVPEVSRQAPQTAPQSLPARSYGVGDTLLPRYWLPWWGYDEDGLQIGALTSAHDPVERHRYAATVLYGTDSRRPAYSLLYQYDGLYPTVQVFAADQAVYYDDFFQPPGRPEDNFWERRRTAGVRMIFPFPGLWRRHFLTPAWRFQKFDGLSDPPPGEPQPDEGQLSGLRLSYLFDNTVRPTRAISPEDGRRTEIAVSRDDSLFGSDFSLTRYTLDWHEFLPLPRLPHHSLAIRLFGGLAVGDRLDQRAFRIGGDPPPDLLQGIDSEFLPLRGYPTNTLRGQKAVLGSAEYRFPLMEIESGAGNGPVFLRRLHGAVFYEGASAFDKSFHLDEMRTAAGLEARLDADIGYVLPVTFRFVVASGLDEEGEDQAYFSLWLRF